MYHLRLTKIITEARGLQVREKKKSSEYWAQILVGSATFWLSRSWQVTKFFCVLS